MNNDIRRVKSNRPFTVRKCRQEDLQGVFVVESQCFRDPYPNYILRNLYDRARDLFFVAEEDDRVIGYVVAEIREQEATVVSVAVLESYRRRGVAIALMNSVLAAIADRGGRRLSLQVSAENQAAISLYTKLGFKKISVLQKYYADGSDALLMFLEIGVLSSHRNGVINMLSLQPVATQDTNNVLGVEANLDWF